MCWITCEITFVLYDFHSSQRSPLRLKSCRCRTATAIVAAAAPPWTSLILHVHFFTKNNSRFIISIKNWIYIDVSFLYFWRKRSWQALQTKNFLNWNISMYISVDTVFDGDYEFDIIFVEKCNKACILQFLLFSLYFSTKIISNSWFSSKIGSTDI